MNYQILANKWRPQTFNDIVGQEYTISALKNSLILNKIHHSYLFSGSHGVGKTTIARLLAKCMNCITNITDTPCRVCQNCYEIEKGCFTDLIEIDAASKTKVEDTRELIDNIQYAPSKGRFKIYLIDEVHMLSRHSFNALLKTLEEPPSHVKFLLATTNTQRLPMTILSRCLQFHLTKIHNKQIQQKLKKILQYENIESDLQSLALIAHTANGSMRDALSLTDQAIALGNGKINFNKVNKMINTTYKTKPLELIELIIDNNIKKIMLKLHQYAEQGINWNELLSKIIYLIHHIAMTQLIPEYPQYEEEESNTKNRINVLAKKIKSTNLQLYYQILLIGKKEIPYTFNDKIGFEMTILKMLACYPKTTQTKSFISKKNILTNNTNKINININNKEKKIKYTKLNVIQKNKNNNIKNNINTNIKLLTLNNHTNINNKKNDINIKDNINTNIKLLTLNNHTNINNKKNKITYNNKIQNFNKSNINIYHLLESIKKLTYARNILIQTKQNKINKEKTTHKTINNNNNIIKKNIILNKTQQIQNNTNTTNKQNTSLTKIKKKKYINKYTKQYDISWEQQINKLNIPNLAKLLALNSWKENIKQNYICLHLRKSKKYLNSLSTQNILRDAISQYIGLNIKLKIVEDENYSTITPAEYRQYCYKKKIIEAYQSIINNVNYKIVEQILHVNINIDNIIIK